MENTPQGTNAINLSVIGSFQTGIFDESAAEIVSFDAGSGRLFVINSDADQVDVLDLADPTNPTLIDSINLDGLDLGAGFVPGGVNSISASNGIVAAAVENDDAIAAGLVVFFDIDGVFLNSVEVGVLPDSVAFSADGSFLLVANEGEPDDGVDPEGSVSVIDISAGVENATVATADFTAFNGREEDLRGDGVRIFPGTTVAEDVEPEFVAIAPDGSQAFVSLQENNAVAIVDLTDLAAPSIFDILPLGVTDFSQGLPFLESISDVPLETAEFQIGTDADGNPIFLGGLSGLAFDGINPATGNPTFLAINDRGPVNGTIATDDPDSSDRPFLAPDLQVTVVTLELDEATDTVTVTDSFGLTQDADGDGTAEPVTGLTNIPGFFEVPLDAATGEVLPNDPFGLDSEGIIRDPNTGNLYIADESAPSLNVYSADGLLVDRFVPIGYADQGDDQAPGLDFNPGDFGTETLPEVYLNRRNNRGFEAVAFDDEQNILYGFIQTPLSNPDTDTSNASSVLRILGIDPETGVPIEEFVYLLQTPTAVSTDPEVGFGSQEVDRIGDAVFAGNGQFFVIERDNEDSDDAQQFIFRIDLAGATNILGTDLANATEGETLESLSPDEIAAAGIQAVNKIQVTNLPSLGFSPTPQTEGLALLPDGRLAVINDNDYEGPDSPTQLGVVGFGPSNGLDASDEDGGINIVNQPVFGLYQPDTIAAFEVEGATFFITANEGDSRDEDARVEDLALDPEVFPDAATLQLPENLGRLEVSTIDGDIDGDGDFDQLFAFGTRSFSIFDSLGNLVFDSGDQFEKITADLLPADFNSDNDENGSFDSRSDDAGPEPEGVAVGEVDGVLYAFIGLERIGGIVVYDISDPANSEFVQYINNRDFTVDVELPDGSTNPAVGDLGPEGLAFISAADSPTGQPLLAVGNEVSGTTTIFAIIDPTDPVAPVVGASVIGTPDDDLFFAGVDDFVGIGDTLITGAGEDEIDLAPEATLGTGDNTILAGSDNDTIFVSSDDRVFGGSGDDTIAVLGEDSRISGGAGSDEFLLESAASGNRVLGGAGDDLFTITDGSANILSGGEGADAFTFVIALPIEDNVIVDFDAIEDSLTIVNLGAGAGDLETVGEDIFFDGTLVATLSGIDTAAIDIAVI